MFMSKLPPIPKKAAKHSITNKAAEIDTRSRSCMLCVLEGNLYLTGEEDVSATTNSFKLPANTIFDFTGKISVISDSAGADIRLLYYDMI